MTKTQQTTDGQTVATDGQPMGNRWVTDREALIIECIGRNGRASIADIASMLGLSKDRSRAIVRDLVNKGVLFKHGNGRYTYYTLLDPEDRDR